MSENTDLSYITPNLRALAVPIETLIEDPANANTHDERSIHALMGSFARYGQRKPFVVNQNGNVVEAGNGGLEAARRLGWTHVAINLVDDDPLTHTGFAIADNRTAELSQWDEEVLARLLASVQAEDPEPLAELWDADELARLLDEATPPDAPPEDDEIDADQVAELLAKWQPARGQLWEITSATAPGKSHRLLCGDATQPTDVARLTANHPIALLATDPPYNVGVAYGETVDDTKAETEYEAFTRAWFGAWQNVTARQIVTPGCNNLARWLRYFDPYHVAPWTKTNSLTNGKVSHWWCWEPVLFFGAGWPRERANDVFDFPIGQQAGVGDHPCPKPLKLWTELIKAYSARGDVVADAFAGSGTAFVAAESLGRACYGTEIEPKYVAVILERLATLDLKPRLIEAAA